MTTIDVPLNLDTRQAESDMRSLGRDAGKTRRRSRMVTKHLKTAAGALGGYGAIRRITKARGGNTDPWSAAMLPIQAAFQQYADKTVGYSAIARKRARNEVSKTLADYTYLTKNTSAAKEYYGLISKITADEEEGRNIVRQVIRGPTFEELLKKAIPGYVALLKKSFQYIWNELTKK